MLRDFAFHPDASVVINCLKRFGLPLEQAEFPFTLLKFEVITPDSFMWRILIDKAVYYLYAEDYVPGLDHARKVFNAYLQSQQWELVEPVKGEEGSLKYSIESGYDKVFLVKSDEKPDDAQFSENAPRGFVS